MNGLVVYLPLLSVSILPDKLDNISEHVLQIGQNNSRLLVHLHIFVSERRNCPILLLLIQLSEDVKISKIPSDLALLTFLMADFSNTTSCSISLLNSFPWPTGSEMYFGLSAITSTQMTCAFSLGSLKLCTNKWSFGLTFS